MMRTPIPSRSHIDFNPAARDFSIRVSRQQPLGPADFAVYETGNASSRLGAGTCPALSAQPPYIEITIRSGIPFTVQSVDGDLTVDQPDNR